MNGHFLISCTGLAALAAIGSGAKTEPATVPATVPTSSTTRAASCTLSCKLPAKELAARRHELIPGLFARAERVDDIRDGLSFRFNSAAGLLPDLARIMEQERACCSFLNFRLTAEASEGPVTFDVTGPPGTAEMLRKL